MRATTEPLLYVEDSADGSRAGDVNVRILQLAVNCERGVTSLREAEHE